MSDVPDWTDQKPFRVTPDMVASFTRIRNLRALSCGLCMVALRPYDYARWVYVAAASNTFVCAACDIDVEGDVAVRFKERWDDVIKPILDRWG